MKGIKRKKIGYMPYAVDDHEEYVRLIKVVLKHTDTVCFTIEPFLDSIEEFHNSSWSFLSENILYMSLDRAIEDKIGERSNLIFMKNDYFLYDFFLN